ncbi:MAG TPA: hypothetical protein VI389_01670 [Geobacteraceae bacterium]
MHKKIIMACMAIAAFAAFVVAPSASALNLTENGTTVGAGASITGTSTLARFIAGGSTVTCDHNHMSGTVTTDSNGTIAGEIPVGSATFHGTAVSTDCTSNGLGPVQPTVNSKLCLHVSKSDTGTVTGCAGAAVTFTLHVTNLGIECKYEKAEIGIEITTAPADAQVKIRPGELAKGEGPNSIFCPKEGELEMEFTLTTTDGTTLAFS